MSDKELRQIIQEQATPQAKLKAASALLEISICSPVPAESNWAFNELCKLLGVKNTCE